MRKPRSSARPESGAGQRPASAAKTWMVTAAGLVTLSTAIGLMASSAPARAMSARQHASAASEGRLVAATLVQRLSAASVGQELAGARIVPGGPALGAGQVRYGVDAYRVTYRTVNAAGRPVLASGLVAFPDAGPRTLSVVSYDHGTTATKADVPSLFGLGADHAVEGRWSAELFASAGFAVTEPDYVGMGSGTGPIEYLVAKSEVTASADLLYAARTLAAHRGGRLRPGVFVTGFSQGGSAAIAFGRALQQGPYFRPRALAPVSGPYDLVGAQLPGLFNGHVATEVAPYYVGYTLTSWNRLYHLYATPGEAFLAPYAANVTGLYDGSHQDEQIAASLPSSLPRLLTPKFLGLLRHPRGTILRAFLANATCSGWTPRVPVRLYAASGDTTVPQLNAEHCAAFIHARGGDASVIQLGPVNHDTSDIVALPQIVRWFLQFRP